MSRLIGRKNETTQLDNIIQSSEPEFVVIFGRRRIGKTFLINQYFNNKFTFKHTGLALKNKTEQLHNFGESLRRYGSPLSPDPKKLDGSIFTVTHIVGKRQKNEKEKSSLH